MSATPRKRRETTRTGADEREKLTIADICAELKVSRSTFYYWRQTKKAPHCIVLPNKEVRVTRDEFDRWLKARTETH